MGEATSTAGRQLARLTGNRAVMAAAGASLITGFAQFTAVAALGDVAAAFGERGAGDGSLADAAGLSFTALGVGLATIRLASLAGLPLAALGDRLGRRRMLLGLLAAGLSLTAIAAASQGFWWFVAALALARPGLSGVNALAGVIAAEETDTLDRSAAVAAITVGYGVGSGSVALLRAAFAGAMGFRGLFALALVLLAVGLPLLWRALPEPARYTRARAAGRREPTATGLVTPWRGVLRRRLLVVAATTLAMTLAASPATALLFLYGENVIGVGPGVVGAAVAATAPSGAVGLLLGRVGADRLGRRPTAAAAQVLVAGAATVTYAGGVWALIGGYLALVLATGAYTPPAGALAAELFPTRLRATAAGWLTVAATLGAVGGLVVFGLISDAVDSPLGGMATVAVPAAVAASAFALVPETRGRDLPA